MNQNIKTENLLLRTIKEYIIPKLRVIRYLKNDYGKDMDKERPFKYIRKLFDLSEKNTYTLDDQSWNDFDMNKVYEKLDRTYSSVGESALYKMLRNPLFDEDKLQKRDKIISSFQKDEKVRSNFEYLFYKLARNKRNTFLDILDSEIVENKFKYYLYTLLGKVIPIILLIMTFKIKESALVLLVLSCINMGFICEKEKYTVPSHGILYLRDMFKTSKKIVNINNENLSYYNKKLKDINNRLKEIDNSTKTIAFVNMWGGVFQPLAIIFLLEETSYYKVAPLLKNHKKELIDLYSTLGEVEALMSISSYKTQLKSNYSTPIFNKNLSFEICEGYHPLLENGVPNSINMSKKGIILTGTNMSGKSTFLRMLGINILFAQTFYFTLAKEYNSCFFNIVSSINPSDDVTNGTSFYMAEAQSILRIINALKLDTPVFCPIDEIFRGTNPIERIAASAEILKHINSQKSLSIVTTHDRELVDILKEGYDFYYFSENVDETKGLNFDYKIRKGVSSTRNAIKLLDYLGFPKDIIEKSYKRANNIDGFI